MLLLLNFIITTFDLVSGNVNKVLYQHGQADRFYHKYQYDADNRVTAAYTSYDDRTWDRDAKYFYYLHGPLARTETGNAKVGCVQSVTWSKKGSLKLN